MDNQQMTAHQPSLFNVWAIRYGRNSTWAYNPCIRNIAEEIDQYLYYRKICRQLDASSINMESWTDREQYAMLRVQDAIRFMEEFGTDTDRKQAVILMDRLKAQMALQDVELAAKEAA